MDQITVRPARLDDIDAIARLWQALVEFHCSLNSDLPAPTSQGAMRYARRLMDHLDDPMARVLVAAIDGEVIGYVLGVVVDLAPELFAQEPSGFLADIYVDADHRRGGVGTALVNGLTDWFRQRNVRFFEWHAAAQNPDGIAFWRALGGRDVMVRMRADISSENDNNLIGKRHKDA
ncbi:MAG TPA: GNAT family N-acetyltransferase [Terriglobales bacterium]